MGRRAESRESTADSAGESQHNHQSPAMLPTRFASMRQKNRPGLGLSRPSFRDDSGLVALRYEKTKPAEPPVPLPPPRNLLRAASVSSTPRSSTTSAPQLTSSSSSSPLSSPVVVTPPPWYLSPIAPPTEQHPALRSSGPATARPFDDWHCKRDSGHAPTATSSATIREEQFEDDDADQGLGARLKALAVHSGGAALAVQRLPLEGRALLDRYASPEPGNDDAVVTCTPPSASSPPASPNPLLSRLQQQQAVASSSSSSSKRLVGRHVSRLSSSHVSTSSEESESAAGPVAPMMQPQPLVRGQGPVTSRAPPTSANHNNNQHYDTSSTANAFSPLAISIPTDSLIDDDFMAGFSFSRRGSIMFGGHRATALDGATDDDSPGLNASRPLGPTPPPSSYVDTATPGSEPGAVEETVARSPGALPGLGVPGLSVLASNVERESQKVRSLYETGDVIINWEDGARHSFCERLEPTPEVPAEEAANDSASARLAPDLDTSTSAGSFSPHRDSFRRETDLAGGLEDWQDVDGAAVDRYGFISVPRPTSRISTPTELKSAQFSPRRRNLLQKRDPMGFSSQLGGGRIPSRKVSARSLNTQNSEMSVASMRSSRSVIRQAGNLLPHNRNRRWMDEAGDMLTVSSCLQDTVEEAKVERISEALKRKEWERSEKWRKMAKVIRSVDQGQGMEFEFDVKNPKLIERTWKGIPDRWRAAAWWSFLASAAKGHEGSASVDDVIAAFYDLQDRSSPDDVQIDLDVPRTISRHIMFRRRYRGGQRLLFRVLHALSIYFPETGYVQGMASLAATLLCYFDEEKCFVMLVRIWQLRGLDRLYRPGFEGLMTALREFETGWLNKDVANKLSELCVDPTAYGTRWYLTLFNLSIPFAAQLRVWDVFLLLGTGSGSSPGQKLSRSEAEAAADEATRGSGLDVLHATGAALIQALSEVLLDSDFENAMKALTSWIAIKDEELLMKVTKAEWKSHQGKKKT